MRKTVLLLSVIGFLLPAFFSLHAQTSIEGFISDTSNNRFLNGTSVVARTKTGEDIGYGISDKNGYYKLNFVAGDDSLFLRVSFLGYGTKNMKIRNQSAKINIRLTQEESVLKEVVISSPTISRNGDTIVFRVDAFATKQDRVIGDILKKLPGFEVGDQGQISYNGKAINQFMIENMDLLGGKYGIATNNLPANAVMDVEVIENNEPVKALKNLSDAENPAVNLKLKKDKLIRPFGTVTAEIGGFDDFYRNLNVFGLQAGISRQAIAMYKTNNTGNDIGSEINEFTAGNMLVPTSHLPPSLRAGSYAVPGIKSNRYLFNNAHLLTLNLLQKLPKNQQLKININYWTDKINSGVNQDISYFIRDTTLQIHEYKYAVQKKTNSIVH